MTLKMMMEEVQQVFPEAGRTQIIFDLNHALREFCQYVRLPYKDATLTRTNDLISEVVDVGQGATDLMDEITNSPTLDTKFIYRLPADCYEVRDTDAVNVDEFEVVNGTIIFDFLKDKNKDIVIHYFKIPTVLLNGGDSPELPAYLQPAIPSKVRAKYYMRKGMIPQAQFEMGYYNEILKQGMKYANTKPWRNSAVVDTLASLGSFSGGGSGAGLISAFGRQVLEPGLNTVPLGASFSALDSFVIMLNGNGVEVNEYDPNDNLDQRTNTSIVVSSADHNPNFEFMAQGT